MHSAVQYRSAEITIMIDLNLSPFLLVRSSVDYSHLGRTRILWQRRSSYYGGKCVSNTNIGYACTTALKHSPSSFLSTCFVYLSVGGTQPKCTSSISWFPSGGNPAAWTKKSFYISPKLCNWWTSCSGCRMLGTHIIELEQRLSSACMETYSNQCSEQTIFATLQHVPWATENSLCIAGSVSPWCITGSWK